MVKININDYKRGLLKDPAKRLLFPKVVLVQGTYEEIIKYYQNTPVTFKGIYKHVLNYLIRKNYADLYNDGTDFLKAPIDYVGLMAFVLPLFKKEINYFIELRDLYESDYINGTLNHASYLLDESNKISYSLWSAINKIKIAELKGGMEARLDAYNDIIKNHIHPMTSYACDHAQETASVDTSLQAFMEQRYKDVLGMKFKEQWQYDYLIALLFPYKYTAPSEWISYCMKSSIIDVYCNLIDHLPVIIESCKDDARLITYLETISNYVNDRRITKYVSLLKTDEIKAEYDRVNMLVGETTLDKLSEYSMTHPSDIDVLYRYVSISASNKIQVGNANGNIREKIIYHLYYLLIGDNSSFHANKIKMICLSNQTIYGFRHLYNIVNDLTSSNIASFGMNHWYYSTEHNVLDAKFFRPDKDRCAYLKAIGADPNLGIDGNKPLPLNVFECLSVVDGKLEKYRLDLEYMSSCGNLPVYTKPLIISYLFQRYFEEKKYLNAVYLYVDFHLSNPGLHIDVDVKRIEKHMNRVLDGKLNIPLELSIFYSLINAKPAKIAANVSRFLSSKGVSRPSELKGSLSEKEWYFMDYVVDVDVIDLIPLLFEDKNEAIEERIKICNKLNAIKPSKQRSNEISLLLSDLAVNKNLEHVEATKIDVDVPLLKKGSLNGARDFFDIYINTPESIPYSFKEDALRKMFPQEESIKSESDHDRSNIYNMPYKKYLFMQVYLMIRDAFLCDDIAGLDSYLSSRVRHGTVVNQLRSHLQEKKLTTRKNEEGGYELNTYWVYDVLKIEGVENTKMIEGFLRFTQIVDEQISILKNDKIQVKTEIVNEAKNACFDFSQKNLQDRIQALYIMNLSSFDTAFDLIIEDLWNYTEQCFVEMRNQVDICLNKIDEALIELKTFVESLTDTGNKGLSSFRNCVTDSRTQLQNDGNIVLNWFQRSRSMASDFDMQSLCRTAEEGIKRVTDFNLVIKKDIKSVTKIQGRFLGTFYVLMNDLFSNVVNYYKNYSNTAECHAQFSENNNLLEIIVTNHISESDKPKIQNDINEFEIGRTKAQLEHRARTEQKSGFYKMHNIICGYFNHPDNVFRPHINNLDFCVYITININKLRS